MYNYGSRVGGFRGRRGYGRVAGTRRIRVGSWNVRSLTEKLFELCDVLGRHKVDIACFQETKWKGSRMREGNGYRLWYSGSMTARNKVGVILAARLKDKVVQVTRRSVRIMATSNVMDGETGVPTGPATDYRGDLNGHIEAAADGYARVHEGFVYGARNEEGRTILEFATTHDIVVANSFFKKTQIGYFGYIVRETTKKEDRDREGEDMAASDAYQMWNTLACNIKYMTKDSVEDIAMAKERYVAKREAKTAVAQAIDKAYKDLYKKPDSKEGANDIYRIAKARERRRRDLGHIRYTKDEEGQTIVMKQDIRKRWGECGN
nr:hypothetical protein [Tanacetum cinerariifolium]